MARIRTIKPEFWTDGTLLECSRNARLLFIGTWNFADDYGNLDRSAKQIKARIFPADDIDCDPLILELLAQGLLVEYEVENKKYLHIQGFRKHQVINKPGKAQCPPYDNSRSITVPVQEHSGSIPVSLPTGREGKGKEREKEKIITSPKPPSPVAATADETKGKVVDRDRFEQCDAALRAIPGLSAHPINFDPVITPIWQLVQRGVDLKTQIIPSITRQIQNAKQPIRRWSYLVPGIESDNAPTTTFAATPSVDDAKWQRLLEIGRRRKQWDVKNYGPIPQQNGCRVPAHLLDPDDGDGWTEWQQATG